MSKCEEIGLLEFGRAWHQISPRVAIKKGSCGWRQMNFGEVFMVPMIMGIYIPADPEFASMLGAVQRGSTPTDMHEAAQDGRAHLVWFSHIPRGEEAELMARLVSLESDRQAQKISAADMAQKVAKYTEIMTGDDR